MTKKSYGCFATFKACTVIFRFRVEREKIGFRFKVSAIFVIFLTKKVSNDMIFQGKYG